MTTKERIPTNLRTLLILELLGKSNKAMTGGRVAKVDMKPSIEDK